MKPHRLSLVILTWNEEDNIGDCLDALARQETRDFEVIVVDAASTDATRDRVEARLDDFPVPLRLDVGLRRISVGEARNRGVALARGSNVAFLSADTVPEPQWVTQALASLEGADIVFGRQVHTPPAGARNGAAAVRGLRYHFPDGGTSHPSRYASNANGAYRRDVLLAFPFGTSRAASAVDDLLLTRRACAAGFRVAYNPAMVAHHRDVDSARAELRKNVREGLGWGTYARELRLNLPVIAWGTALVGLISWFAVRPSLTPLLLFLAALWAPALRRAVRRLGRMHRHDILVGVLLSPPFDLAFLLAYVRGLLSARVVQQSSTGRGVGT